MDLEKIISALDRHNHAEWYIFRDMMVHDPSTDPKALRDFDTLSPWLPAFVSGSSEHRKPQGWAEEQAASRGRSA